MVRYLRLLRLPDQYIQFGAAIASGVYLGTFSWEIFWWAVACTCLSFAAFVVNEVSDRKDTDRVSWNPIHAHFSDVLDMRIVWAMFVGSSVVGLMISWRVGFFWWAVVLFVVGILYSLEPIRFKRRVVFDMIAQLLVWCIIPFVAPAWGSNGLFAITITTCLCVAAGGFLYQIADIVADEKAGLKSTHVVLGLRKSLKLAQGMGIAGVVSFFVFGQYQMALWIWPWIAFGGAVVFLCARWLQMDTCERQIKAIQAYVPVTKNISRLFVPYLLFVWLW